MYGELEAIKDGTRTTRIQGDPNTGRFGSELKNLATAQRRNHNNDQHKGAAKYGDGGHDQELRLRRGDHQDRETSNRRSHAIVDLQRRRTFGTVSLLRDITEGGQGDIKEGELSPPCFIQFISF